MFEAAEVAPPLEEEFSAFPDRPEGWTDEDERLLAEEDYRRWAPTVPPEAPPAHEQPSGWAAFELDTGTTDPTRLSDAELINAMVGFERVAAWAEARQARLVAEFATRRPSDDPALAGSDRISATSPYAPDEIGLALRVSRWSAKARIGQSLELLHRLPDTLQAWQDGQLDERRVTAICDATRHLNADKASAVQHRVLGRATRQTLAQLKAALGRAVLVVDPEGAAERHRSARRDRRVAVGDEKDGMASLWALLSAPDARAAYQWLSRLAHGVGTDDPRGMDARRADLLVALLTGHLTYATAPDPDTQTGTGPGTGAAGQAPAAGADRGGMGGTTSDGGGGSRSGRRSDPGGGTCGGSGSSGDGGSSRGTTSSGGTAGGGCGGGGGSSCCNRAASVPPRPVDPGKPLVQVVMPFSTLIGADDQPCELVGHGAIPADLAREIATDAVLKRLVYDPLSGALLDHGRTTYRPPAALADFVRARDVYCRSPICRRRALDAELDHVVPYPRGTTSAGNLAGYCAHDHHMKHSPGWQVRVHDDGGLEWITPTGHRYLSHPYDYRPDTGPSPTLSTPSSSTTSDGDARRRRLDQQSEPADPGPADHAPADHAPANPDPAPRDPAPRDPAEPPPF